MQDDYNRFIRRSIRQAQCNYEDIFTDNDNVQETSCGCGMTVNAADMKNTCGCGITMNATDMTNACECEVKCEKNVPVMVFVAMQPFGRMYNEAEALCRGTLFPALDKPFTGRGGHCR